MPGGWRGIFVSEVVDSAGSYERRRNSKYSAGCSNDGRSGPTWWSLQNRGSPRPRSRAKHGGRAPEAPKGGRRVPRRGDTTRPLTQNLRGKMRTSLKIFPRNASCPPRGRGNERFLLTFNGRTRSARHRNILHKTQNSAVLHVNFPDSFARHNDSFVPAPRG